MYEGGSFDDKAGSREASQAQAINDDTVGLAAAREGIVVGELVNNRTLEGLDDEMKQLTLSVIAGEQSEKGRRCNRVQCEGKAMISNL